MFLEVEIEMEKYIRIKDLEDAALGLLPKTARDYYKSGATEEYTLAENKRAFQRLRIRPKCLVGVSGCDLGITVMGQKVSMPVGISPTAMQRMAHPDGELANARGLSHFLVSVAQRSRPPWWVNADKR